MGGVRLKAAIAAGISVVWRRVPITTATIVLVTGFWVRDYVSFSAAAASSTRRSATLASSAPVEKSAPVLVNPQVNPHALPESRAAAPATMARRVGRAKATHAGFRFRQKLVGQNEVDYVTNDVTIRLFNTPVDPRLTSGIRSPGNVRHFGKDVTVRYFDREPALASQKSPESTAARAMEHPTLDSK